MKKNECCFPLMAVLFSVGVSQRSFFLNGSERMQNTTGQEEAAVY